MHVDFAKRHFLIFKYADLSKADRIMDIGLEHPAQFIFFIRLHEMDAHDGNFTEVVISIG